MRNAIRETLFHTKRNQLSHPYPPANRASKSKYRRNLRRISATGSSGTYCNPGNTVADTEGCLLPGRVRHGESVQESRVAFVDLFAKLQGASGPISLTVSLDADGAIL